MLLRSADGVESRRDLPDFSRPGFRPGFLQPGSSQPTVSPPNLRRSRDAVLNKPSRWSRLPPARGNYGAYVPQIIIDW